MTRECGKAFDSIESAHDFVGLLAQTVREAKQDIEADVQKGASNGAARRQVEALRMAAYCLTKLELHMAHSSRILNDLRTLRRLLNEERVKPAAKAAAPQTKTAVAAFSAEAARPRAIA
ncbi:MAG TPA: hypothetical protein VFU76_16180 [Terriglobales bacterium]|nr:hypothetical protein [Terriglobales bacterium]